MKFKPEMLMNAEILIVLQAVDQWLDVVEILRNNGAVEGDGALSFSEILEAIDREIDRRKNAEVNRAVLSLLYDGLIERKIRPDGEVGYAICSGDFSPEEGKDSEKTGE